MCGVASRFANVRNGWSSGSGSWSKTSMAAPAILWALSAAIRSASTTIGPRDVFTRRAVGFMSANSGAPTRPRPIAEADVDGNDVRSPEQLLLRDQLGAHFRCALGRQILT